MRDIEMYKYIEVGNWNNDDRLKLDISMVKFPENSSVFTSLCSAQCDYGHVKVSFTSKLERQEAKLWVFCSK